MDGKEKVLQLAKKLNELYKRGDGGEAVNAYEKLKTLMLKYGFSFEDIEGEKVEFVKLKSSKRHELIATQCVLYVQGKDADIKMERGRKDGSIYISCTKSEYLEISSIFNFFKDEFDRQYRVFERAFIHKNNLLPHDVGRLDVSKLSKEEAEELLQVIKMKNGMNQSHYRKQLNN